MNGRNFLAGLMMTIALSASAHAATLTFSYTATVTSLQKYSPDTGLYSDLQSYAYTAGNVSMGDKLTGYFTFDTSSFYNAGCCTPYYQTYFSQAPQTFNVSSAKGFDLAATKYAYSMGTMIVQDGANGGGYDSFSAGFTATDFAENYTGSLHLYSQDDDFLHSDSVPTSLDLSKVTGGFLSYLATVNGYQGHVLFSAQLDTITAVPEPSSAILLLSGLVLLFAQRIPARFRAMRQ